MAKVHRIRRSNLPIANATAGDIYITDDRKLYVVNLEGVPVLLNDTTFSDVKLRGNKLFFIRLDGSEYYVEIPQISVGEGEIPDMFKIIQCIDRDGMVTELAPEYPTDILKLQFLGGLRSTIDPITKMITLDLGDLTISDINGLGEQLINKVNTKDFLNHLNSQFHISESERIKWNGYEERIDNLDITSSTTFICRNKNDLDRITTHKVGDWAYVKNSYGMVGGSTNKPLLMFCNNFNDTLKWDILDIHNSSLNSVSWNNVTDKPTTLTGYGITDEIVKYGEISVRGKNGVMGGGVITNDSPHIELELDFSQVAPTEHNHVYNSTNLHPDPDDLLYGKNNYKDVLDVLGVTVQQNKEKIDTFVDDFVATLDTTVVREAGDNLYVNRVQKTALQNYVDNGPDLTNKTTDDLVAGTNNHYITTAEKNALLQLPDLISFKDRVKPAVPESADASNLLVTRNELNNTIVNLTIRNLKDVKGETFLNNNILAVIDGNIESIKAPGLVDIVEVDTVKNTDVNHIKFDKAKSTLGSNNELIITPNMYSTDLIDMPDIVESGKILVSNNSSQTYELKNIEELTDILDNKIYTIENGMWEISEDHPGKHVFTISHLLTTKSIIIEFYNSMLEQVKDTVTFKILDEDNILVISDNDETISVVLNSTQGTITALKQSVSDMIGVIIDDTRPRIDRVYSSHKLMKVLDEYIKKDSVYNKIESDQRYGLKVNEHTHNNIETLSLFTSRDDKLFWDGSEVNVKSQPKTIKKEELVDYSNSTEIVNVEQICQETNITLLLNTEILIQNKGTLSNDIAELIIYDGEYKLIETQLKPGETQKYNIGMSKDIRIFVNGHVQYKFIGGGY